MSGGTTARSSFNFTLNRDADRAAVDSIMERARVGEWATRLASRDTTLWSDDSAVQEKIAHRLGWIDAPNRFTEQIPALEAFGEKIRAAGFTTAIVASSVTRRPLTKFALRPEPSIARVMALPPPCTTTTLIPQAARNAMS